MKPLRKGAGWSKDKMTNDLIILRYDVFLSEQTLTTGWLAQNSGVSQWVLCIDRIRLLSILPS